MICGHCTAAIEKAIKAIDLTAKVTCDTSTRKSMSKSIMSERTLDEAIRNAGYDIKTTATI